MLKRAKVVETAYSELTRALKAAPDPAVLVRVNMAATAKLTSAEKEIQRLNEEMKVRFSHPQNPVRNLQLEWSVCWPLKHPLAECRTVLGVRCVVISVQTRMVWKRRSYAAPSHTFCLIDSQTVQIGSSPLALKLGLAKTHEGQRGGAWQGDLKELESMKDVHGTIAALKSKNQALEKALASQQQQGAAAAARTWEKEREALLQVRRWLMKACSATHVVELGSFWR
jgi:hypothetical protein